MPWTRLNPTVVVQQLRVEHGPGDEGIAGQALAHLREALLSGVCSNKWRMLADTRLAPHCDFLDGCGQHLGIFPGCGTATPFEGTGPSITAGACR